MIESIIRLVLWILRRECFDIGRRGLPMYLTRWTLLGKRFGDKPRGKLFLHLFHRGDAEPYFHDHPWPFWSLILWGGYWEYSDAGRVWYGPGSLLKRPASWRHRVELAEGKRCWTLVWCGPKERSWGFHCPDGRFMPWRQHEANQSAGGEGCE